MSIIWCGGEDIDFPIRGTISYGTSEGHYRSGYARHGLSFTYATAPLSSTLTSGWLSFRHNVHPSYMNLLGFGKNATSDHPIIGAWHEAGTTPSNKWSIVKYDGTTRVVLTTSTNGYTSALSKYDLQVSNYGVSGTARLYVDGLLACEYTGDLTISGSTNFDTFSIFNDVAGLGYASEFIVADEDTRLFSLVTLVPNAAGDTNTFTSGTYTDIDEIQTSDADTAY